MPKILLLDDDTFFMDHCTEVLDNPAYNFEKAHSAEQALDLIRRHPFDLLIFDIDLPGINGIELLKIVKKEQKNSVVIMLTRYDDLKLVVESMRQGAFDYIKKSSSQSQLPVAQFLLCIFREDMVTVE